MPLITTYFVKYKKTPLCGAFLYLAEREGFEPSIRLNTVYTLSRRARSTTPAPLRFLDLKEGGNFR